MTLGAHPGDAVAEPDVLDVLLADLLVELRDVVLLLDAVHVLGRERRPRPRRQRGRARRARLVLVGQMARLRRALARR